jgi:transposase
VAQLDRLGVQPLLDQHFPTHGNWGGLSLGWVTVVWLTPILSEADHRLNHVEPWAQQRLHTLRACTGQPVHPLDVGDDRLATVLEALRDDTRWRACEGGLNQHALRVYDLQPACVRLDRTTASGYWRVTADGLFPFGPSKDHRPDLPQGKIMISALDPLGLPVATDVGPGQRADDPLYVPAISRVRERLGRCGLLDVGDCKMAALDTRANISAGGDDYLCPLSERLHFLQCCKKCRRVLDEPPACTAATRLWGWGFGRTTQHGGAWRHSTRAGARRPSWHVETRTRPRRWKSASCLNRAG